MQLAAQQYTNHHTLWEKKKVKKSEKKLNTDILPTHTDIQ